MDNRHLSKSNYEATGIDGKGQVPMSLRYMNEFVGKLQCAPKLLELGIFPDAKEVSETMGLFNATRRFLDIDTGNPEEDGIVVVGDGSTPRSAVMFAYRTKGWMCYSVDPEMRLSTETERVPWEGIQNVVPIRAKIENIRIKLRRAIVLLVHAHVTLDQALSAIEADTILGVVTLPCCNWYGQQEILFNRPPDIVFDDFSILSDHREVRVWAGEQAKSLESVDINPSARAMKGCVIKKYVSPVKASQKGSYIDKVLSTTLKEDGIKDIIEPFVKVLDRFLLPNCQIGLVGDNGTFANYLMANYTSKSFLVSNVTKDSGHNYDIIIDLGVVHDILFTIETRQASALVLDTCTYMISRINQSYSHAGFISLTPRRKLKGAAYFTNSELPWQFEWFKLENHTWLAFCGWLRPAKDKSPDFPSIEDLQADMLQTYNSTQKNVAEGIELVGKVIRVRIKHKNLLFADIVTTVGKAVQIVLNKQVLLQGKYTIPQTLSRLLRIGDSLRVFGMYDTAVVDAKKLNVIKVAFESIAPREEDKLHFGLRK
ncbi:hypothetical protein THRCLA_03216 [Thraustotheca clavata]|uniref:Uncharacterized protein n=1 Tax=Thraustotheca clavata TaxID=74557 RepID=A0A1W0A3D5_9STRA|nr:hypothetical protein THRCLA_03216 [Thraustotheca clavata]